MRKRVFKEKCVAVNNIINGKECEFYVKENNSDLELLDYAISQLDTESQRIIYFDFIYRNDKDWWRQYYSKSTYYRLKNVALDLFMEQALSYNL